jgi:hypothetical protein
MFCKYKNRDCPHAGSIKIAGCKEWEETEVIHEYIICYNDEIGRDVTKCK